SRRRHTRSNRDWSSDVCSSDLVGRQVHERPITLAEVTEGVRSGRITEVFACGTAAVVTPIGSLKGTEFDLAVGDGQAGPVTKDLYEHLTDLQFGRREDNYGWMRRLV